MWASGLGKTARQVIIKKRKFLRIYLEMARWELSWWFTETLCLLRSTAGPPCIDTPKVLAGRLQLVATHNHNMLKVWFYIYSGNTSISAFSSLPSLLLPLYNQLWSSFCTSQFFHLGSPWSSCINLMWALINVDADTSSLFGEEYCPLFCLSIIKTKFFIFLCFVKCFI